MLLYMLNIKPSDKNYSDCLIYQHKYVVIYKNLAYGIPVCLNKF